MSKDKRPVDEAPGGERPQTEAERRRTREAAALRANLLRRKRQQRARRDGDPDNGAAGA